MYQVFFVYSTKSTSSYQFPLPLRGTPPSFNYKFPTQIPIPGALTSNEQGLSLCGSARCSRLSLNPVRVKEMANNGLSVAIPDNGPLAITLLPYFCHSRDVVTTLLHIACNKVIA